MRDRLIALVVGVLWPGLLSAQNPIVTGINGSPAHGATITINGSNFGTKPQAAPVKFDDFVTVPIGAPIASSKAPGPAWMNNGGLGPQSFEPVASTVRVPPGSANPKVMESHFIPDMYGVSNVALIGQDLRDVFVDVTFYIDTTGVTSGGPQNIKPWRLHSAGAGAPSFNPGTPVGCSGTTTNWVAAQRDGVTSDDSPWHEGGSARMCNAWVHMKHAIRAGTSGFVQSWVNGEFVYNHRNVATTALGQTGWPEWYVGNYIRNDNEFKGIVRMFWGPIYIDNSFARVELGDASTYSASRHTEPQIPEFWSPTQITVRVNQGTFRNGQVFLFVCNAANVCGPGFRITIGNRVGMAPVAPGDAPATAALRSIRGQ